MTEILIIKPSSLGDIVHALQVATSLKAQCAGLRISWVVREMFAPIVRACEAVDQVYVFERAAGAKGFLKLTTEIRKTKFDFVFDMQGLLRTGLMTSRALAKKKWAAAMLASARGCFTMSKWRCHRMENGATPSIFSCSFVPCWERNRSCAER